MQQKINEKENILLELKQLEKQQKQTEELQKEYNFPIPAYVLSEMQTGNENVFALINLALINKRISEENADILKRELKNNRKDDEK